MRLFVHIAQILSAVIPCFSFSLAGIARLSDPFDAALFIKNALDLSLTTAYMVARGIGGIELLLGIGIALAIGRSKVPAYLAMCLLAFFVGLLIRVINLAPEASTCGCFGSLMGETFQTDLWTQVKTHLALAAVLLVHILAASVSVTSPTDRTGETDAARDPDQPAAREPVQPE